MSELAVVTILFMAAGTAMAPRYAAVFSVFLFFFWIARQR